MPLLSFIAPLAGRVCKRLDGVPLAIELAAARAAILGIEVLAEKVDESIRILGGGHRTALPHHQTLEASFDLSYNFLSETERKVLSRLGVLRGAFTLKDDQAVAASEGLSVHDVTEAICALIAKSFVTAHLEQGHVDYRLLETVQRRRSRRPPTMTELPLDFESGRCHAGDSNDGNGSRWKDTARLFHKPRQ